MTTDDERPGPLPFDRLDYGDAEQRAEMAGADEPAEEPVTLVDEPVQVPQPHGRRDQRPLPT